MAGVDVPALCRRRIARRHPVQDDIVLFEERQRHMAGAGCPLAILAVALRHPDRLGTDRVFDGPAEALASSKWFARHGSPPSPASAVRVGNAVRATQFGAYDPGSLRGSRRRTGSHTRSG